MSLYRAKHFKFELKVFEIKHPSVLNFKNNFYQELYEFFFSKFEDGKSEPHIDCDKLEFLKSGTDYYALAISEGVKLQSASPKSTNKEREEAQIAVQAFCNEYPLFVTFLKNCRLKADIAIKHAETLNGESCNIKNFIKLKRIIGQYNALNWEREMDTSERQASVSNLGTISENLLKTAFGNLTDETNFFKVTSGRVNSYGDFVLMCLPNNLWLSVKSNFARERLLASGYSNDILAVGFFEEYKEFTSQVKIRNMQRAGFLCIYIPDVAVTQTQEDQGTSTYEQTINYYNTFKEPLPLNINGTDFFRPLSSISDDLEKLLSVSKIERRLSVDF